MIEDRNIICIASNWSYDPTSKHHVMRRLAERNHIVWVNYHGSRRPRLNTADGRAVAAKLRQMVRGPRPAARNVTVLTPPVAPWPGSRAAALLNRRLLVRAIRGVLRKLPPRPVQLWSFAPDVDYLCGAFDEECIVYYCVDEFSAFEGYDRDAILAAERRLAARADLVITTSQALYDSKRALNDHTALVTHGVDVDHFTQPPGPGVAPPDDVARLPRPVLGFWGLIQDWVDVRLLAEVARERPDWSMVLIGEALSDVSALRGLANVHLLGRRPYERLPAYAAGLDAALIPFRVNELTRAVNPIKLREYLAAGLPVVSTPLPEVLPYRPWVTVAQGAGEFIAACHNAVLENGPAAANARRRAMQGESWSARLAVICGHVETAIQRRRCPGIPAAGVHREPVAPANGLVAGAPR